MSEEDVRMEVLLYYRYVLPRWDESTTRAMQATQEELCKEHNLSGRVRVSSEGLNVNLSGAAADLDAYQEALLQWRRGELAPVDFKRAPTTTALAFRGLKVWTTAEICALGKGSSLPPDAPGGRHVSPQEFRDLLSEATRGDAPSSSSSSSSSPSSSDTSSSSRGGEERGGGRTAGRGRRRLLLIDTRNLYEARLGRFVVPGSEGVDGAAPPLLTGLPDMGAGESAAAAAVTTTASSSSFAQVCVPPTCTFKDFPAFVDSLGRGSREHGGNGDGGDGDGDDDGDGGGSGSSGLANTTVAMYCTGGVRCERASAYVRQVHGGVPGLEVVQLEGGIHRFLEAFPDGGGFWRGQNYVFDRREVHGPAG